MLNTIEEAIEDIKAGKIIIVVDDEDREVQNINLFSITVGPEGLENMK